jgi:hypothetical protein
MTETPLVHGASSPFNRFRNARSAALRGAKVGAVVAGAIFVAAIAFMVVPVTWQRWSSGTPLFRFSMKAMGLLVGNFVGGSLVSTAWGAIIGGFVMGIVGACRRDPSRMKSSPV